MLTCWLIAGTDSEEDRKYDRYRFCEFDQDPFVLEQPASTVSPMKENAQDPFGVVTEASQSGDGGAVAAHQKQSTPLGETKLLVVECTPLVLAPNPFEGIQAVIVSASSQI